MLVLLNRIRAWQVATTPNAGLVANVLLAACGPGRVERAVVVALLVLWEMRAGYSTQCGGGGWVHYTLSTGDTRGVLYSVWGVERGGAEGGKIHLLHHAGEERDDLSLC